MDPSLRQASDPTTDPDKLDELLRNAQQARNEEVEIAIAKNPNARLTTLHRVRGSLACHVLQNPSLPLHERTMATPVLQGGVHHERKGNVT